MYSTQVTGQSQPSDSYNSYINIIGVLIAEPLHAMAISHIEYNAVSTAL